MLNYEKCFLPLKSKTTIQLYITRFNLTLRIVVPEQLTEIKSYKADLLFPLYCCNFRLWFSTRVGDGWASSSCHSALSVGLLGIIPESLWAEPCPELKKNKGLCPPGNYHLVGNTKHVLNTYAIFFPNRPHHRLEKLENVYSFSLRYKISTANTALDYNMPYYECIDNLYLMYQCW